MSAKQLFYLFLSIAGAPAAALAGISSGGGFLPSDATNPWFLENTATVSYCIEHDSEAFHASDEIIRRSFSDAVKAWKDAFHAAALEEFPPVPETRIEPYGILRIGTQEFVEIKDCANADLRLQLGVLSEDQKQQIGDPRQSVGATYRTSYDTVQMRGKGFIYIAADSGALRPTSPTFHERPWELCDGCLLRGVFAHELGHVFGIAHGGATGGQLEHELFPFLLTNRNLIQTRDVQTWKQLNDESRFISVFEYNKKATIANCHASALGGFELEGEVFGRDIPERCVQFQFIGGNGDKLMIRVAVSDDSTGPWREIGTIQAREDGSLNSHTNSTDSVLLYLPQDQKVLSSLPVGSGNLISGVHKTIDQTYPVEYRGLDGKVVPVQVRLYPHNRLEITAIVGGQVRTEDFEERFF